MTTAYITSTQFAAHTLAGHVEHAGRLTAIQNLLAERGILARTRLLDPQPVTTELLAQVHTRDYLALLEWSETQDGVQFGPDTYVLPESYHIARLSAGGLVRAVEAVMSGEVSSALVATRPPGHHAVADAGMGFCLLSNIALAAAHALQQYNLERVLIMDIDVHHGNGTQAIFYNDPRVLFISTHQYPWYPGSGAVQETGHGKGAGFTINIPLPAGVGDQGYREAYERVVWPAMRRYQPQLILVSAGFDAHFADPLCHMGLSLTGYADLTRQLISMAREVCQSRIIFALEGGYNLISLSHGMLNTAYALLGDTTVSDPLGRYNRPEPDIRELLASIRQTHHLDNQ